MTTAVSDGARRVRAGRATAAGRATPAGAFARHRKRLYVPFVAPALLLYTAFLLAPVAATVWISLHTWAGAGPMEWAGVSNYERMFQDPVFRQSFSNTLLLLLGGGAVTFALSFGLTMLLRDMTGRSAARSVIFFPNIVPPLVVSILWGFLFQADGLVNAALRAIGIAHPPAWLAEEDQFKVILLGIIWMSTGYYTTIIMAAVDRIPPYLYEDCALAGANAWQRFRHVTLPLSWDVIGICAVLWTINAMKTFEFIIAMAGSSSALPATSTWTASLYAYASAFMPSGVPQYGIASASAVVTLVMVAVLVVLIRRVMRRDALEF
ncbi:sugar ABC transporter permease [Streptomyces sp. PSKA54]|uniref:Sugar ABC transporter permease n=1 Tax=Streptomyces himalayensis subsp. aureolus TaxID=2758039 RepID=A0A7W2D264_9ACTN|nr:sugar ABC transporter permease [Streptomyces himalayensis]MBA4863331.1 sugar ABC transporter permease [Streptomyces himalayensis subsp. aureolus]